MSNPDEKQNNLRSCDICGKDAIETKYHAFYSIYYNVCKEHLNHKVEIDLFEHRDKLPIKVRNITDTHLMRLENEDRYKVLAEMTVKLKIEGYAFDYYLDAEPCNLRKI